MQRFTPLLMWRRNIMTRLAKLLKFYSPKHSMKESRKATIVLTSFFCMDCDNITWQM